MKKDLKQIVAEYEKRIPELQKQINEWADQVKSNPVYYLTWGVKAFMLAASLRVFQDIFYSFKGRVNSQTPQDLYDYLVGKTLERTPNVPSSTSVPSNLIETYITAAYAEEAKSLKWEL